MKTNEQIIDYIRDGIHAHDFFNYDGHLLKIRPLRSVEIDDAKIKGYKYVDPRLAKMLINIYIGKFDVKKLHSEFPPSMYENFDKYYREIDYWIVFHAMKDFAGDDFTIDDVRLMRYVHDISKLVLSMTSSDSKTIKRILRTEDGEKIAHHIYTFNIPLVSTVRDMTPIQETFLYQSNPSVTPEKLDISSMAELERLMPDLKRML